MTITRFAPSPTGHLHVGNLRTALFNFLIARKGGGQFILRLDDTDPERTRQEFVDSIMADLEWLGLGWDRVVRQSERLDLYAETGDELRRQGRLYECFETPDELALKRKMQLRAGNAPVYDRTGMSLDEARREELRASRPGYWRFCLDRQRVAWTDAVQGSVSIDAASVSDPVLIRADGQVLYTLASVADDVEMKITNVVRGADHITNTAAQVQIMQLISGQLPGFAHHSLLTGADGGPLAKRQGANSIRGMREAGIEPMTILTVLAFAGSSAGLEARSSVDELAAEFSLSDYGTAPTRIDDAEFGQANARFLASRPFEYAEGSIAELGVPPRLAQRFWDTVRENISTLGELEGWWSMFRDGAEPVIGPDDRDFVAAAMEILPEPPYGGSDWKAWTDAVARKTGRKGRALFMPLRLALTGKPTGPDMGRVMQLLQKVNRC